MQYLTFTGMEISLALNLVARNMHKPTKRVKEAMELILRYLANRPNDGLTFAAGRERREAMLGGHVVAV